jgi:hypothetical protein
MKTFTRCKSICLNTIVLPLAGGGGSAPAILRGQIYLGDGLLANAADLFFGQHPPGAIIALGLAGE